MNAFKKSYPPGCQERDAGASKLGYEHFFGASANFDGVGRLIEEERRAQEEHHNHPAERRRQFDNAISEIQALRASIANENAAEKAWDMARENASHVYDSERLNTRWTLFVVTVLVAVSALFQFSWLECIVAVSVCAAMCIGGRGLWCGASAARQALIAGLLLVWNLSRIFVTGLFLRYKTYRRNKCALSEHRLNRIIDAREQSLRRRYESAKALALRAAQLTTQ